MKHKPLQTKDIQPNFRAMPKPHTKNNKPSTKKLL